MPTNNLINHISWRRQNVSHNKHRANKLDATTPSAASAENTKRVGDPGGLQELLCGIGKALFNHMHPIGIEGEDGMLVRRGVKDAIAWLRTTPEQLMPLLNSVQAEIDLPAAVVVLPSRVSVMISARLDIRIRVRCSGGNLEVSVAKDTRQPKYFIQELTTGYDPAHALHLLVDPADDPDQQYVMLEINVNGCRPKGWLEHDEAARWAAEGRLIGSGSPPDEKWEWRPPDCQRAN